MLISMLLWSDNCFQLVLFWVPTQETLNKSNKVKWSKLKKKKWLKNNSLVIITCPKSPLPQRTKILSKKAEPCNQQSPELGHKKCKAKSLYQRRVTSTCTNIIILYSIQSYQTGQYAKTVILHGCYPLIYPVSQKNAVHFSYCLTIVPYLLSFFWLKNKYLTIFIST